MIETKMEFIEDDMIDKQTILFEIEQYATKHQCGYMEASLEIARQLEWDASWMGPYIQGSPIETMIKQEAMSQGLLKRDSNPTMIFE